MNRYLRMGTRRCGVPRPKSHGLGNGEQALAGEDSSAIDSVYDEIAQELNAGEGLPDEENDTGAAAPPALSRAWCGERGAFVAVRAPKALINRR